MRRRPITGTHRFCDIDQRRSPTALAARRTNDARDRCNGHLSLLRARPQTRAGYVATTFVAWGNCSTTTAADRGIKVIIAAAGMSAHLAGVMAALTHLPVLGVPMDGKLAGGLDALLATCNMPKGIPVGTMSMGSHGAVNAALFAAAILATSDKDIEAKLIAFREKQTAAIPEEMPRD